MSAKRRSFFFEVPVSPKKPKIKSPEPPSMLILAPFKPVPKIDFLSTHIKTTSVRELIIKNPTNSTISIELLPPVDAGENNFTFSSTTFSIPAQGEDLLEIIWSPEYIGSWRYNITVKNLNGSKKFSHIAILATSLPLKPSAKKRGGKVLTRGKSIPNITTPRRAEMERSKSEITGYNKEKPPQPHQNKEAMALSSLPHCDSPFQNRLTYSIDKGAPLPTGIVEKSVGTKWKEKQKAFSSLIGHTILENREETQNIQPVLSTKSETSKRFCFQDQLIINLNSQISNKYIEFNDVKIYKSTSRQLIIRNPSQKEAIIELEPPIEMVQNSYVFSSKRLKLGPSGEKVLIISWSPKTVGRWEYIIMLRDVTESPKKLCDITVRANSVQPSYICNEEEWKSNTYYRIKEAASNNLQLKTSNEKDSINSASNCKVPVTPEFRPSPIPSFKFELDEEICNNSDIVAMVGQNNNKEYLVRHETTTDNYSMSKLLYTPTPDSSRIEEHFFALEAETKQSTPITKKPVTNNSDDTTSDKLVTSPPKDGFSKFTNMSLTFNSQSESPASKFEDSLESNRGVEVETVKEEGMSSVSLVDFSAVKNEFLSPNPLNVTFTYPTKSPGFNVSLPFHERLSLSRNSLESRVNEENNVRRGLCFEISPTHKQSLVLKEKRSQKRKSLEPTSPSKLLRRSPRIAVPLLSPYERGADEEHPKPESALLKEEVKQVEASMFNEKGNFLQRYFNMDPFGPATLEDPFALAKYKMYSVEWLEKQELELIKWLNTLLAPPAELETVTAGVDVRKLWEAAISKKTVQLAPTKEVVSTKFHSDPGRLNALRKAAKVLINSDKFVQVLGKLHQKVSTGVYSIKDGIDIHKDQGARRKLCELIMCYNPLWLRIGLEAIYNREIQMQSNKDIRGLLVFIDKNFLSDEKIASKHSYAKVLSLKMPTFKDAMNNFVVFKFLTLLFVLDQFKTFRLIPYDPCLFRKDAQFKASTLLLNEFTKEFLKCVSQMKKGLNAMGYELTYTQKALDEYDFAVASRLDLRDGVRLTRAMEIILKTPTLCSMLRTPAISKTQKVFNVGVSMKALKEANFEIVGDISPKDIVEGHKEKTMSLLWQILHKFLLPRFESSAVKIQRFWRNQLPRVKERARLRSIAAVKIQALWRGYSMRKQLSKERARLEEIKEKRIRSVILIQSLFRAHIARKKFLTMKSSAIVLQQYFKKIMEKKHSLSLVKQDRGKFLKLKKATIVIQRRYKECLKMKVQRAAYLELRRKTVFVQQRWRFKVYMTFVNRKKNAVILIQKEFRKWKARKYYRDLKSKTLMIQKSFRKVLERRRNLEKVEEMRNKFLSFRCCACTIQKYYRSWSLMKRQRLEYVSLKRAAVFIQHRWRYRKMKGVRHNAAAKIQSSYRAYNARQYFLFMKANAIKIQNYFRAYIERKKNMALVQTERKAFLETKEKVSLIQCRWKFRKYARARNAAATRIQRYFRTRKTRQWYLDVCKKIIVIQRWYRIILERRQKEAEVKFIRDQYLKLKQCAVVIQRIFRARCLSKKQRKHFMNIKRAAVFVQCRWRFKVILLRKKAAAIKIQTFYRGYKERIKFLQMKSSSLKIQHFFRRHLERKWLQPISDSQRQEYLQIRKSALVLQKHYRARIYMKHTRSQFLNLRSQILFVQTMWRFKKFKTLRRDSAIVIQSFFRAWLIRKKYISNRNSAIIIQRWFRLHRAKRFLLPLVEEKRQQFLKMRSSAVTIQKAYRSYLHSKVVRRTFVETKRAAIFVQCIWRYKKMHAARTKAAMIIQNTWRSYCERKSFLILRQSTIKIQMWFRKVIEEHNKKPALPNSRGIVKTARTTSLRKRNLLYMFYSSCRFLKTSESLKDIERLLIQIETVTVYSPNLCQKLSTFEWFHRFMWDLLDTQSRSIEYQNVYSFCLSILLNMALLENARKHLWEGILKFSGIRINFHLMMKFLVHNPEVFCKSCTLFWLLARNPQYAEILKNSASCEQLIKRFYTRLKTEPFKAKKNYPLPATKHQMGYFNEAKFFQNQQSGLDHLSRQLHLYI